MTLTLNIDDRMAEELKSWAEYHNSSAENSAMELLRTALLHAPGFESWKILNSRRLDLIEKRHASGLMPQEERDLEELQKFVAKLAEPSDNALLEKLSKLEALVK